MREYASPYGEWFRQFVQYREVSGKWNSNYDGSLSSFDRFCARHPEWGLQEAAGEWCIKRKKESVKACRCRGSMMNSLIDYLNNRGLAELRKMELPVYRKSQYIPHAFTQEELERFFAECDRPDAADDPWGHGENMVFSVLFRLLYSSGIRTCEARMLKTSDVDLESGILNIRTSKGPDQHYVVLHDSMLGLMQRFDAAIRAAHPQREYFFPGKNGKPYTAQRLSMIFRRLWGKVSEEYARAYDLRHHYAITNINTWDGRDNDCFDRFTYLGKSMGHKSIESTNYYYSLVPSLSAIVKEQSEAGFNNIIPEVGCDED